MSTMIAIQKVYPVGYSTLGSQEYIDGLMSQPHRLLIDTRISPKSWNADWCKNALQTKYGERYRWAGKFLGNKGLNTGRIEIADPVMGIKGLIKYLNGGHDLILLCQCRDYSKCHRSEIVRLLTEQVQVDIVQFASQSQPEGQEEALAVETEQLSTEIAGPFVGLVDRSLGHCALCLSQAILVSSSGREDSVYCETHGRCSRCKTSVEHFVSHPNFTNYLCPCVVEFEMQRQRNDALKQAKPVAFSF